MEPKTSFFRFNLRIVDSVFEPGAPGKKVYVKSEGNAQLYKVWIFLEGADLPYVESVMYKLHPTFPNPEQTVRRTVANPSCQLVIWTWGLFKIKARVMGKNGRIYELEYQLQYDQQLREEGVQLIPVK